MNYPHRVERLLEKLKDQGWKVTHTDEGHTEVANPHGKLIWQGNPPKEPLGYKFFTKALGMTENPLDQVFAKPQKEQVVAKKKRTPYSQETKDKVLQAIAGGMSKTDAAKQHNVGYATVVNWTSKKDVSTRNTSPASGSFEADLKALESGLMTLQQLEPVIERLKRRLAALL
jgi:transposase-like protein